MIKVTFVIIKLHVLLYKMCVMLNPVCSIHLVSYFFQTKKQLHSFSVGQWKSAKPKFQIIVDHTQKPYKIQIILNVNQKQKYI